VPVFQAAPDRVDETCFDMSRSGTRLRLAAFAHFVSRKPPVALDCASASISAVPVFQAAPDRVDGETCFDMSRSGTMSLWIPFIFRSSR
jgi:hypothetical protein